jgi:excisionase family DNA binding protein
VRQVARAAQVSINTVRAAIKRGDLQAFRPGLRSYRITRAEFERWYAGRGSGNRPVESAPPATNRSELRITHDSATVKDPATK